jgi:chorismate mutase
VVDTDVGRVIDTVASLALSAAMDRLFALRGANTVERNDEESILAATSELVSELIARNDLTQETMVSWIFTLTSDLNAAFPAVAARQLGINQVPLICTCEIPVPGALPKVVRTMLHYYAPPEHEPQHVYLRDAKVLRTDLHSAQ